MPTGRIPGAPRHEPPKMDANKIHQSRSDGNFFSYWRY